MTGPEIPAPSAFDRLLPPGWVCAGADHTGPIAPEESLEGKLVKLEAFVAKLLHQAGYAAGPRRGDVGALVFNIEPEVAAAFQRRIAGVEGSRVTVLVRPDVDRPGRVALNVSVRLERS